MCTSLFYKELDIMKIFLICLLCGFFAQMIDGTLGMAYGVSCNTLLRSMGIPSAMSSFCVHTAEIFTSLFSGISHFTMKNFDKKLFLSLILPGVVGGMLGAYILTNVDDGIISPIISVYLVIMGIVIFAKAFSKKDRPSKKIGFGVYPLALIGGFSDSLGGGGWGPVVTSTLVASDCDIRKTIGSVNAAEFFVTLAESITFFLTIGSLGNVFPAVIGLIAGGVLASPIAAYLCKKLPLKPLMMTVGILIVVVNLIKLIGR